MDDPIEPANLRFLRRLVTVLTTVMICGVLVVIGLLVTRLNRDSPILPQEIALPEGASAVAFTQGPDWYAVVTDRNEIIIFDRLTGKLRQTVQVTP
ncbi:hypothetical protein JQV19_13370 [Sulfitobacter mediterraneus]|jgi:hypothetical protein|uniref:Uncharacterized protein n=1 Tax=Sulfitobacter mediterraneus TaxID=83219 RepID=A0A061SL69_9RHOB|nr:DUF6476 family protein [Sulfitobacter mediterraneus]KAJ02461.1 hypothetical protein PM02_13330 [Sulfitobacter mediterraneus]KIN79122.1 hypothetical protein Z950_3127 [Sulfitobacter mediterraneus KCTC 32188]MBM1557945.1 hypothetical protein [Sulfitobacter mediterraneus]MBM1568680.1 hypothetical protein [Sulfitobacter mediterraneus]MBM1573118.1 hypothetical protein [Sulfitobacter mediterraneus]